MLKHLWAKCSRQNSLRIKWRYKYVIKNQCLWSDWTMKVPSSCSWAWKKLLHILEQMQAHSSNAPLEMALPPSLGMTIGNLAPSWPSYRPLRASGTNLLWFLIFLQQQKCHAFNEVIMMNGNGLFSPSLLLPFYQIQMQLTHLYGPDSFPLNIKLLMLGMLHRFTIHFLQA